VKQVRNARAGGWLKERLSLCGPATSNRVVQHQNHDGPNHGDEHGVDIQAVDAFATQRSEQPTTHDCADYSQDDVYD